MSENETPAEPAAEDPTPESNLIDIDQFAAVQLKIGRVVEAGPHPDADRLLVMKVDTGDPELRQIVAGIRAHWEPEDLVGKKLVVCCNLKPARLRGVESQGMMLAVSGTDRVWPLTIEGEADPGTRVT